MALQELEKEKLMVSKNYVVWFDVNDFPIKLQTILKYDENRMNASHSEFCNIYELIQKFFSSDYGEQVPIKFNSQSDKKN